jgi:hypothetical protein
MKRYLLLIIIILTAIFISCENDDIPIETILWEEDGQGFIQFSTNDYNYRGEPIYMNYINSENPMVEVDTIVKKISGFDKQGFGIIFCYQDSDNYYRLMITIKARYQFSKYVGGEKEIIIDWSDGIGLVEGFEVENRIRIVQETAHNFRFFFNGADNGLLADTSFDHGDSGFLASVSVYENFPSKPEDCRYKQILPVAIP